ncbi:MAG: zinc-binding dehydrogenase [Anaerolineales bacterium]
MRVARLHGPGEIELHEEPVPEPAAGETLVYVRAVGVCGSDLHWWTDAGIGDTQLGAPLVLGHEFAGSTPSGERVAVDPAITCGECEMCRGGSPNLCSRLAFAGHGKQDGAFREALVWPTRCLHVLPDALSFEEGALLEPLGVALHAVDLGGIRAGAVVGVFGCGPIGLLIAQLARVSGATTIVATDVLPHRVEAATGCGAHHALLAKESDVVARIKAITHDRGLDVAFEAAGEQDAVDAAVAAAAPGGTVVLVGIPSSDLTAFRASEARRKELKIQLVRRMKNTYPRAIRLVSSGAVDLRSLVTDRYPLGAIGEAFSAAQARKGLKVLVEPG